MPVLKSSVGKVKQIDVSSSGNTAIWTPASGKEVRLFLIMVNTEGADTIYFRFGSTGDAMFKIKSVADGIFSFNLVGANVQGGIDEVLYFNQTGTDNSHVTVVGEEF